MPSPLTVYYSDGRVVRSVYPSELQAHLNDGGSLNPISESPEIPTETSPESSLNSLSWKQLKELATKLGLTKPDDVTWTEFIPEIEKAQG